MEKKTIETYTYTEAGVTLSFSFAVCPGLILHKQILRSLMAKAIFDLNEEITHASQPTNGPTPAS